MTQSEINVQKFFKQIGCKLFKIPETSIKTPDFYLKTTKQKIIIEVKEITENEDEKKVNSQIEQFGETDVYNSCSIGKRFRVPIQKSNRQLKKHCINNEPGLLIIQDVRSFANRSFFYQEEIKQAMFGDRVTWINQDNRKIAADIFQENKTTTDKKNTTISAVAILIENVQNGVLTLHIYHNPFAKNKLISPVFQSDLVYEYEIESTDSYCNFRNKIRLNSSVHN